MRADRLLSIMLLLQVHRRITAHELAKRLEVSERTIYRDMEALSVAGIPVSAERGTGGGLVLAETFRTNLTGLSVPEIQSLFLGRPTHLLHDLGLHKASEAALIKLNAVLPAMYRFNAEYVRQRIYVDVAGWHNSDEERLTFLPLLQEAVWQERKIAMTYQRSESAVERVIDPLGLVAKGRVWYLVAAIEGGLRSYRISRIQQASLLEEPCKRPEGFDLASYWSQSAASFVASIPRFVVTARLAPDALPRMLRTGRFIQLENVSPPDPEGLVEARLAFDNQEEACSYLLGFGPGLEILEPLELREQVIQQAQSIIAFYAQKQLSI